MDKKLKAIIVEHYGTQRAFCKATGIPEADLSNYLHGIKDWRPEHSEQAVKRLGAGAKEMIHPRRK